MRKVPKYLTGSWPKWSARCSEGPASSFTYQAQTVTIMLAECEHDE